MSHIDIGKDRPARLAVCLFALSVLALCAFFGARDHLDDRRFADSVVRSAFCTAGTSDAELYKYRELYDTITER